MDTEATAPIVDMEPSSDTAPHLDSDGMDVSFDTAPASADTDAMDSSSDTLQADADADTYGMDMDIPTYSVSVVESTGISSTPPTANPPSAASTTTFENEVLLSTPAPSSVPAPSSPPPPDQPKNRGAVFSNEHLCHIFFCTSAELEELRKTAWSLAEQADYSGQPLIGQDFKTFDPAAAHRAAFWQRVGDLDGRFEEMLTGTRWKSGEHVYPGPEGLERDLAKAKQRTLVLVGFNHMNKMEGVGRRGRTGKYSKAGKEAARVNKATRSKKTKSKPRNSGAAGIEAANGFLRTVLPKRPVSESVEEVANAQGLEGGDPPAQKKQAGRLANLPSDFGVGATSNIIDLTGEDGEEEDGDGVARVDVPVGGVMRRSKKRPLNDNPPLVQINIGVNLPAIAPTRYDASDPVFAQLARTVINLSSGELVLVPFAVLQELEKRVFVLKRKLEEMEDGGLAPEASMPVAAGDRPVNYAGLQELVRFVYELTRGGLRVVPRSVIQRLEQENRFLKSAINDGKRSFEAPSAKLSSGRGKNPTNGAVVPESSRRATSLPPPSKGLFKL